MKRKTNLFYTSGPDSKFLTFSNYTESLTGNFLSTDTKIFPDKFLCLKLNGLNKSTKENFIKYLVKYYENKLASLRDNCVNKDILEEKHLLPLAYLLEAILKICQTNTSGYLTNTISNDSLENPLSSDDIKINDNFKLITYIGNITEQDYNGTYTDTICCINCNEYYEGKIVFDSVSPTSVSSLTYTESDNTSLYGWTSSELFEGYQNVTPLYDSESTYNYDSKLKYIKYIEQNESGKDIVFNVIIPLYSIVNVNYNSNSNILEPEYIEENGVQKQVIILNSNVETTTNLKARIDVPLGIWIQADEEEDSFITLKKDSEIGAYPFWSLLISSQFKPFPYSRGIQKDTNDNSILKNQYYTFAETLSKINDVLDGFNNININITKLENRLSSIESQIKTIGTNSNISRLDDSMLKLNNYVKNEITEFKKQLAGYVDNITWKYNN